MHTLCCLHLSAINIKNCIVLSAHDSSGVMNTVFIDKVRALHSQGNMNIQMKNTVSL